MGVNRFDVLVVAVGVTGAALLWLGWKLSDLGRCRRRAWRRWVNSG